MNHSNIVTCPASKVFEESERVPENHRGIILPNFDFRKQHRSKQHIIIKQINFHKL